MCHIDIALVLLGHRFFFFEMETSQMYDDNNNQQFLVVSSFGLRGCQIFNKISVRLGKTTFFCLELSIQKRSHLA